MRRLFRRIRCALFHGHLWRPLRQREDGSPSDWLVTWECPKCGDRWVSRHGAY